VASLSQTLVRCRGCGRLCQRSTAVNVRGLPYGPECAGRAQVTPEWRCGACGRDRDIAQMATPDLCKDCDEPAEPALAARP
jgi:hypothetical protein